MFLSPFHKQEMEAQRLNNLPTVTQLVRDGAELRTGTFLTPEPELKLATSGAHEPADMLHFIFSYANMQNLRGFSLKQKTLISLLFFGKPRRLGHTRQAFLPGTAARLRPVLTDTLPVSSERPVCGPSSSASSFQSKMRHLDRE